MASDPSSPSSGGLSSLFQRGSEASSSSVPLSSVQYGRHVDEDEMDSDDDGESREGNGGNLGGKWELYNNSEKDGPQTN